MGNYQRAYDAYSEILSGAFSTANSIRRKDAEGKKDEEAKDVEPVEAKDVEIPREVHLYAACCLFYMQMYQEAEETVTRYDEEESTHTRVSSY